MRSKILLISICLIASAFILSLFSLVPAVQASNRFPQDNPPVDLPEITPTPVDPLAPAPTPFVQPEVPDYVAPASLESSVSLQEQLASASNFQFYPLINLGGVTAFYRNGQTFITWTERTEMQGEQYKIYRSQQPITPANIAQAYLLGTVGKNSAVFFTNRYNDLSTHAWKVRYSDRLIIENGSNPVPDGYGLYVWTLSPLDFGGQTSGTGYYAVTVTPPGGKETLGSEFSTGAINEAISDPLPVEITTTDIGAGGHVYIQYMNLRSWNPTFHAPNPSNNFYGWDSKDPSFPYNLQYAYDYAVFTPTPDLCGGSLPSSLPVLLHLHGWKDNTSSHEQGYPDKYCAYGIYPIDVKDTWYFGFAKDKDYRKGGEPAAGDTIVNYTEQRVLRMVYDLIRNPPGPAVDANRIFAAGQSMGGTGSLSFAERYPNVFAATYSSQPVTNFATANINGFDWVADASLKWGRPNLALKISLDAPGGWANHLKKYNGVNVWDWQNLQLSLNPPEGSPLRPRILDDMAPFTVVHEPIDPVINWSTQGQPLYTALNQSNRTYSGMTTSGNCQNQNDPNYPCHRWMYYIGQLPSLFPTGVMDKYHWIPFWGLKPVKNETIPGISNSSASSSLPAGSGANYLRTVMWSSSWNAWDGLPTDQPGKWSISLCSTWVGSARCEGNAQTVDVTPRRMQNFAIKANTTYHWENRLKSNNSLVASGTATSDGNEVLTVTKFQVTASGNRLVIYP